MTKLMIPIEKDEGIGSPINQHFGRARVLAVIKLSKKGEIRSFRAYENIGKHFGGYDVTEEIVADHKPAAVIVRRMGSRGLATFKSRNIAVLTGDVTTVREAVNAYVKGKLVELTEACREARHRLEQVDDDGLSMEA